MLPPVAERPKLRSTLDQLSNSFEELLLGGLTTANEDTRRTLTAAMQEAARVRLLRLGAVLRVLADDLHRFNTSDPLLSRRRLTLFLNRGWLLARGLTHALDKGDEKEYDRLNATPTTQPLANAEVVCLGAAKKVMAAAVRFDFRFRVLTASGPLQSGDAASWSFIHPVKNKELPPEAYLHYAPRGLKFKSAVFLEKKVVTISNASVMPDPVSGWRISLTDASTAVAASAFTDWSRFLSWTPAAALERLSRLSPGPLDLDAEFQEEIVLRDYRIAAPTDGDDPGQTAYPLMAAPLTFHAVVGAGIEGATLQTNLNELRKPESVRPPLFGLMHYERCRLVLQPLTTFAAGGPTYLTISPEKFDIARLIRELV